MQFLWERCFKWSGKPPSQGARPQRLQFWAYTPTHAHILCHYRNDQVQRGNMLEEGACSHAILNIAHMRRAICQRKLSFLLRICSLHWHDITRLVHIGLTNVITVIYIMYIIWQHRKKTFFKHYLRIRTTVFGVVLKTAEPVIPLWYDINRLFSYNQREFCQTIGGNRVTWQFQQNGMSDDPADIEDNTYIGLRTNVCTLFGTVIGAMQWDPHTQWLKWGGSNPPPTHAPIWAPAIVWGLRSWAPLIEFIKCYFMLGVEWVWGLLQPGIVRWAPPPCFTWPF